MAQEIMFNPITGRKIQVDAAKIDSALANGLVKYEEHMKATLRKEEHWMKDEKGDIIPVSGDYLEYMKERGYIECTETGEPLEKTFTQKVIEKVRKPRKHKDEAPEVEPGTDNV